MKYQVVRATILSGGATPSTYEKWGAQGWEPYDWTYLKIGHFGAMRVFLPVTFQGVSLRFQETYHEAISPVLAQNEAGGAIEVSGAQASANKGRTISAEIFTCDLVRPVFVDAAGLQVNQNQETALVFVLKGT